MTLIKICGLSEVESALSAARAGADMLGFVFAESRRRVTPEKAAALILAIKHNTTIETVGVFAGSSVTEVNRIAKYCSLDRVQLSGGESWEYCRQVDRPVIKVIHVAPGSTDKEILAGIEAGQDLLNNKKVSLLLDTKGSDDRKGGTGKVFDWTVAKNICARYPVFVAGGLNPQNVGNLIEQANPYGVDVSSGVETGGKKDTSKIKAFIENVRGYEVRKKEKNNEK
jgi:phosphoribosylanthranilate isomerase